MADHPMDPILASELGEQARALRALARHLVGEQGADDLVQDTTLAALRWPPERRDGVGAWLLQVLRRLASNHRRAAARRERRERFATAPAAAGAAARVAEHRELLQRVTAALLALPEPYHGTLLLRFFEDLTPTAIAQATGVPLATVKSRLQRGIVLLRERLDATAGGGDWRAGFVTAFGLGDTLRPAAVVGAGTLATGAVLMGTGTKLVAAAALSCAAFLAWITLATPPSGGGVVTLPAPASSPVAAATQAATAAAPAAGERTIVRDAQPSAAGAAAQPLATVRGRCVDENGAPLAGVDVRLTSNARSSELMDAWTKDHDLPPDTKEQRTTSSDGAFAFEFWPPPPMQYVVWIRGEGRAFVKGRVEDVVGGRERDLGDVVLPPGSLLHGTVRDTNGAPVPGTYVTFARQAEVTGIRPAADCQALTRDDGAFATYEALPAGEYTVRVRGRKTTPSTVTIDAQKAVVTIAITVEPLPVRPTIRGVVVDEAGQPVARATVGIGGYGRFPVSDGVGSRTDDAGVFTLTGPERSPPKATLCVHRDGFEDLVHAEPVAWGSADVRLVLRRALALEVFAVAAGDGAPVEQFQVRVVSDGWDSRNLDVRARGRHPGGRAVVEGIARGDWLVVVEPAGDELALAAFVPVHVADPGPARVTVRLPRAVEQQVNVKTAAGEPVAGTRVELALMREGAPSGATYAHPLTSTQWAHPNVALLLDAAITDAQGNVRLRGPADQQLVLFARGPGHVPAVLHPVQLDANAPLELTVGTGGSITGKVGPAEAIAELRRVGGLPTSGAVPAAKRFVLPGVRLWRTESANRRAYWPEQSVTIGDDGTFRIDGAAAGQWCVDVTWWTPTDAATSISQQAQVATVVVRDGATVAIELDLSALLPGEIDGLVLHNGAPAVAREMQFELSGPSGTNTAFATTDAAGRFRLRTRCGEYVVSGYTASTRLSAIERVRVVAGQTVAQTFTLQSGTLRCRVIDEQGKPVSGVRVDMLAEGAAPGHARWMPRTDDAGVTSVETAIVPVVLSVLPEKLQDPAAQRDAIARGETDPFAAQRIELGRYTPKPGETTAIELRLPASWRR